MIKSFVISIPSLYHRLDSTFWPSISKVKSIKPKLFEGVDGKNYTIPEWWSSRPIGGCIHEGETFEPAVWGLVQTYVNLFDTIISNQIDEPILILEDDSVIIDSTTFDSDIKTFIENLPADWAVGYISGYHGKNRKEVVNDYVVKVSSVMQTNAVLYNGFKSCKILRDYIIESNVREPIDVLFLSAYNNLKIPLYRSTKKLLYQASYQSTAVKREYLPNELLKWQI